MDKLWHLFNTSQNIELNNGALQQKLKLINTLQLNYGRFKNVYVSKVTNENTLYCQCMCF